jgi:hypothetical protein
MTHKATSLIKRLLDVNDKTRLGSGPNGAKDIKAHPFFDGTLPCGVLFILRRGLFGYCSSDVFPRGSAMTAVLRVVCAPFCKRVCERGRPVVTVCRLPAALLLHPVLLSLLFYPSLTAPRTRLLFLTLLRTAHLYRDRLGPSRAEAPRAALQARARQDARRAGALPLLRGADARLRQGGLAGRSPRCDGAEVLLQLVRVLVRNTVCCVPVCSVGERLAWRMRCVEGSTSGVCIGIFTPCCGCLRVDESHHACVCAVLP